MRKPFSNFGLLRYPSALRDLWRRFDSRGSDLTIFYRYEIPRLESVLVRTGDPLRQDSLLFRTRLITKVEIDVDGGLFMRF